MNCFEKFIYALQYEVEKPPLFGWFHLTLVAVIAALVALVVVFRKKISRKFIDKTLLVVGIILVLSEILKQCLHSMEVEDGVAVWEYAWRTFPFQFCSVPMYLYLIAGIFKKGKVNNAILCFLATFSLFGGLAVVIYPSTVLSSVLYFSVHSLLWHGAMLIIGMMILLTNTIALNVKSVLKACIIFIIILALAQAMNFMWHFWGIPDKTFSMFYISPYYACDIPVLHDIKENAPYVVFLLSYLVGFIAIAFLVMGAAIGINKLYRLVNKKHSGNS